MEKSDLELMWGYDESPASAQGKTGRRLGALRVAPDDIPRSIDAKLQVGRYLRTCCRSEVKPKYNHFADSHLSMLGAV